MRRKTTTRNLQNMDQHISPFQRTKGIFATTPRPHGLSMWHMTVKCTGETLTQLFDSYKLMLALFVMECLNKFFLLKQVLFSVSVHIKTNIHYILLQYLMDSNTRRCQGEEDPPEDGGDSLETRRTVVGKANIARISFLVSLNEDLLKLPARGSDVVKIISSAGWLSQLMLPVPQRC